MCSLPSVTFRVSTDGKAGRTLFKKSLLARDFKEKCVIFLSPAWRFLCICCQVQKEKKRPYLIKNLISADKRINISNCTYTISPVPDSIYNKPQVNFNSIKVVIISANLDWIFVLHDRYFFDKTKKVQAFISVFMCETVTYWLKL